MDEEQAVKARRGELRKSLEWIFHEDTRTAVEMMIAGLWLQYPDRVTEEDRRRFLAALAQLPTGHGSKPSLLVDRITEGRPEGQPAFRLIFVDGGMWHHSVRRFDTEGDTMQYGAQFLLTLRLEGRV